VLAACGVRLGWATCLGGGGGASGNGASGSTWALEATTATANALKIFIPPPTNIKIS
jgi:hypothetical protein